MTIEDGHRLHNLEQVNPPRIIGASFSDERDMKERLLKFLWLISLS